MEVCVFFVFVCFFVLPFTAGALSIRRQIWKLKTAQQPAHIIHNLQLRFGTLSFLAIYMAGVTVAVVFAVNTTQGYPWINLVGRISLHLVPTALLAVVALSIFPRKFEPMLRTLTLTKVVNYMLVILNAGLAFDLAYLRPMLGL